MRTLGHVETALITVILVILIGLFITTSIKLESELRQAKQELSDYKTRCLYRVGDE